MKKFIYPVICSIFFTASSPAMAENDDIFSFFEEEAQVITASRRLELANEAPSNITVITGERIRDSGAAKLSDILALLPGVQVIQQKNGQENIWIRGAASIYNDKAILLIDGFPLKEVEYGQFPIDERLPIVDIKRIEVVKGPGSVVYGANAFTGVINIITKDHVDVKKAEVVAGFGNWKTQNHSVLIGRTFDQGGMVFSGTFLDSQGSAHSQDSSGNPTSRRRPVQNTTANLKLALGEFTFAARHFEYESGYLSFPDTRDEKLFDNINLFQLGWKRVLGDRLTLSARSFYNLFQNHRDRNEFKADLVTLTNILGSTDKTNSAGAGVYAEYSPNDRHAVISGIDFQREKGIDIRRLQYETTVANPVQSLVRRTDPEQPVLNNWAVFAQETWRFHPSANLNIGLRHDRHDQYGDQTNSRFVLAFHPDETFMSKAIYGTAYRAPSVRELYVHDYPVEVDDGNPNLRPEKIESVELDFRYRPIPRLQTGVALYRNIIRDFIAPNAAVNRYDNVGTYSFYGMEPELIYQWSRDVSVFANYTLLRARDFNGNDAGDIARETYNFGVNALIQRHLNVNAALNHVGRRTRPADYQGAVSAANRADRLGAYNKVNLTLTTRGWPVEVSVAIYNLFDVQAFNTYYGEFKYDLEQPRRSVLGRIKYSF